MKRVGTSTVTLFILLALLAGCVAPTASVAAPAEAPSVQGPAAARVRTAEPAAPAEVVMLEMFHDKATWAENTDQMGQFAAEATGVCFESIVNEDTTNYQATVRASMSRPRAPDLYTWWSGFRMEDIVKAGGAADLTDIWQKYIDAMVFAAQHRRHQELPTT